MPDATAHTAVALIAAGMGLAFFVADRKAPTSRALALFLVAVGLSIACDPVLYAIHGSAGIPLWGEQLNSLFGSIAFIAGFEWGLRVARTIADLPNREIGDRLVRVAQGLVVAYWVLTLLYPELLLRSFSAAAGANVQDPAFYLFAVPLVAALVLVALAGAGLWMRSPDRLETTRLLALLAAGPFLAAGLVLPDAWVPVSMALGEAIFLVGAIRYHVQQGARAQFLSRFLSPQVARLVRERGLQSTMQTDRRQLSVVCCDIRGFTAYAKATAPDRVIRVLREYYREAGRAVAEYEGTIKDQAGDGILILVGAPIAQADHARRAVALARLIRERVAPVLGRWSGEGLRLGLGLGVASGDVAVGVIGDASRLEYTAVGPAVNLASRLCERAADGEIRLDAATVALAGSSGEARETEALTLKGFEGPVPSFVL